VNTITLAAFHDELEKIGAARLHGKGVLSSRKGRRPISAANLLRKEKDGKLTKFQHVKEAFTGGDSAGHPSDVSGGWDDDGAAKPPMRRGELPAEVKSTTMSTKEGSMMGAFYDEVCKIATVPGAPGSVNPFNTGENALATPETRQHPSPGDIPTQDQSSNIVGRTEVAGPQISTATGVTEKQYVPGKGQVQRRGDVPGMPKDPSAVDHMDGRGEATTVTGLAQNSAGIGAFTSPAEHVG
jgi:hypothetical protein